MRFIEYFAFSLMTMAAVIAVVQWLRARDTSIRLKERHDARLAERDRIARELHDTLLQGMEGLILKIYAAAHVLPSGDPTRALLLRSLDQFEELAIEGRQRLRGLRDPDRSQLELSQALDAVGLNLSAAATTTFNATKSGKSRALNAFAWDEIYSIAREALGNAFKHSSARHIETIVLYGSSNLTVQIKDDGVGISSLKHKGSVAMDHFGLRGMHERAKQLRASLDIKTADGCGTMVMLKVPASVAYCSDSPSQTRAIEAADTAPEALHESAHALQLEKVD